MDPFFYDAVLSSPVIAAVKDPEGLADCLSLDNIRVVFFLFGDLCSIPGLVAQVKDAGKIAMVHTDRIAGLSQSKEIVVDFLKASTQLDGVISTRPSFIRRAKELELFTVLRLFAIDSMALSGIDKLELARPDFLEVLPGVMPKAIRKIVDTAHTPLLAGGLISDKEDVMAALNAGATAVSSTDPRVWRL